MVAVPHWWLHHFVAVSGRRRGFASLGPCPAGRAKALRFFEAPRSKAPAQFRSLQWRRVQ